MTFWRFLWMPAVCVIACMQVAMAQSHVPGIVVNESNSRVINVDVIGSVVRWDTIKGTAETLQPIIKHASVRQSSTGDHIQWVRSVNVVVPSETGFAVRQNNSVGRTLSVAISPLTTPDGAIVPTVPIVEKQVSARYTGIARGRHIATIDVVVAEWKNGLFTSYPNTEVVVDIAPSAINNSRTAVSPETGLSAFVVNPDAPWTSAPLNTRLQKGERVQNTQPLRNMYSMTIPSQGIYRITSEQLSQAGIPTDATTASTLKVFGRGGLELSESVMEAEFEAPEEQPIIVATNSDGSIKEVIFYASGSRGWRLTDNTVEHYINHYEERSVYLLSYDGNAGMRATARASSPLPPDYSPLSTTGYVFQEEELTRIYNEGSGRKWFGRTILNNSSTTITTQLPGLLRTGEVWYRSNVAHKASNSGTFTVFENSQPVAQRFLPAVPQYMDMYSANATGSISASSIASDGRSVLRFLYEGADANSNGAIDWFEIHYPRGMVAVDGEFELFSSNETPGVYEYSVNGFGNSRAYVFDITDKRKPQLVQNIAPDGGLCTIREEYDDDRRRQYFMSSTLRSVSLNRLPDFTLRSDANEGMSGDYLVIAHPEHLASAKRYADYRASNSELKPTVVGIDQIYREFGYTIKDPTALRNYVAYVYHHASSKPRYVMLWGDGHFDYKLISTSTPNFLLPYESLDADNANHGLITYTSDDYFVRVDGDDKRPDVAIGRMPITSNEIGDKMLAKIQRYENESSPDDWRTRICFVADDGQVSGGDSDGALHLNQSETLAREYLPLEYQPRKIYLAEYPVDNIARGRRKPGATADMVSTINTNGALLLNWIGHGNPRVWAHEGVFVRETTPQQFSNTSKPFFLTAATCDFARFDLADIQSGAEDLVLLEKSGAIGVFSAARVVFSAQNAAINQEFYTTLFTPEEDGTTPRLGDVLMRVKQTFFGNNDEKFFLLGDPTLRLLIPDHGITFEKVNGVDIRENVVQVEALSTVTIEGFVTRPLASNADEEFSGVATISLLDATRDATVIDNDRYQTVNRFQLPGAALMRGAFSVKDGRFSATFVVPKDISFSSSAAKLYGYAVSDDNRTARGSSNNIIVDGVSTESFNDFDGPEIDIFLDSRLFVGGNIVRENPILIVDLSDATGVNGTGIGIGHGIEATFVERNRIEDITETFSTSLENSRAGTATKQIFGLGAGYHTVRVRAWDVLNNMSEKTTTFRIATDEEGTVTSWVSNYPNPFYDQTTVRFKHNISGPFSATLRIYSVNGSQVYDAPMQISDMQTAEITWDGRDNDGNVLSSGVYLAVVQLQTQSGEVTEVAGKLALIR